MIETRELVGRVRAGHRVGRALLRTVKGEIDDGTLRQTLVQSVRARTLSFAGEPTFGELLARRARAAPDAPFLAFEDERITAGLLDARANAVAAGLATFELASGDTVALMCPNCPEFLYAFFAIQKLGLGAVPVNTALVGDGLRHVLDNSRARVLIVHVDQLAEVLHVRERLSVEHIVVITEGEPLGMFPTLEAWLVHHAGAAAPASTPDPDAVALLMYTSGTTGRAKGVVYRYRDSNTKRLRLLANLLYDDSDVLLACLPLFHANALLLATIQALNVGARLALCRRFSASRFWAEAARLEATSVNALGAMIPILLKQPPGPFDRAHRIRTVVSAACPHSAWRAFEERFGVRIIEAYGAVDAGGFITLNLGNAPVGSIGTPLGKARYRLVDETGCDAPPGEPGELQVWTGSRRVEYFRDTRASQQKHDRGWLRTGDLPIRDERGFLYFAGRATDSMRRRGENVSAFEVESVIDQHDAVLESAVFGVPSELGEEDIMAVVVPCDGRALDPAELSQFLTARLARHACPRFIEIAGELPKTATHRVQKSALKERGVTDRTWEDI